MTPERAKAILDNQSSVAQKIFAVVPIQEAWSAQQIGQELARQGTAPPPLNILLGCLRTLADASLVSEPTREMFRSRVRAKATTKSKPEETTPMPPRDKPANPVLTVGQAAILAQVKQPAPQPLERLTNTSASLRERVRALREEADALERAANELDETALALMSEQEANAAVVARAQQFQQMMKAFQEPIA